MKISKTHQRFSYRLKEPRALTNPEDFLGPNWEDVINFWFYIDTLSEEEKRNINKSYGSLDHIVRSPSYVAAHDAAKEVVGKRVKIVSYNCASKQFDEILLYWPVIGYATWELIGSHKLLEQGKPLTFLPLCIKKKNSLQRLLSSIKSFILKLK
jgi:hypothetical protein